jgi:hypothetical protein
LPVEIRLFLESTSFTSSTFPIQPDFSQNQPAAVTLNPGSPRTLASIHTLIMQEEFEELGRGEDHMHGLQSITTQQNGR